ncbi:hypothetical protein L596_026302 [Steinernema carpocapsae]|uniref:Uncharacterized protein n=1 Tax=Steinernema carpocapsae TaxID=34508 RepID=A0A4U5M0Y4_STECR|nr:hypothetical protein L596_026302 [Steinernema carpocapsae]
MPMLLKKRPKTRRDIAKIALRVPVFTALASRSTATAKITPENTRAENSPAEPPRRSSGERNGEREALSENDERCKRSNALRFPKHFSSTLGGCLSRVIRGSISRETVKITQNGCF